MFKKVLGVALTAAMVASIGAVAVSAAEVEENAVAADDSSSAVSADASEATGASDKIYFDIESSGWKTYETVYCHLWSIDGKYSTSWQTKAERCTKESDGKYSYDLTKWADKAGTTIKPSDGNIYCVIFSTDTQMQTYNTIMSGSCIGDTCYVTGNQIENPVDSEKKAIEAAWRNNKDCGAQKVISSTANVIGSAYADGETSATLMANYLITYYNDDGKLEKDKVQKLFNELKLKKADVQKAVEDKVNADSTKTDKEKSDIIAKAKTVMEPIEEPKDAVTEVPTNSNDTNKNNSSNSNSNNNSSNKTSNGSGSVQSGQDMTIYFVFGGVMVAAAGVMFLARKKD